jgi:hypothetical protein
MVGAATSRKSGGQPAYGGPVNEEEFRKRMARCPKNGIAFLVSADFQGRGTLCRRLPERPDY